MLLQKQLICSVGKYYVKPTAVVYRFPEPRKLVSTLSMACCRVKMLEDDYSKGFL